MGSAAERKHQIAKLKTEMALALKAAPDRRARRKVEEEFQRKLKELEKGNHSADSDKEESAEAPASEKSGPSRQARRAELKQKRLNEELSERLERHARTDLSRFEEERIFELLPKGYSMLDVPADGSCLYHAIAHQLRENCGQEISVLDLKTRIADWIESHSDEYAAYLPEISVEEHCRNIRETRQYGGEVEIKATSEVMGLTIIVFTSNGIIEYQPGDGHQNDDAGIIRLVFLQHKYGSPHYNSLHKSEDLRSPA